MTPEGATTALIGGRYRPERKLGTGGMSTVMLAHDVVLERLVAVKLLAEHLADDPDFVMRFRHEALAIAQLQHPNIVQVYDTGLDEQSSRQYIVMEYVEGDPLSELLRQFKRLEPGRAVEIAAAACAALAYAHRAGIVHRDVKPANLLVPHDAPTRLVDFGIARAAEQTRVTQVGSVLGTAAYLSPEQAHGEATGPASDIYSLAVCTYQMLAGRLPHEYKSLTELAIKQQQETIPPITDFNPLVPPQLDRAIRAALNLNPELRYETADDFARALRAGLGGHDDPDATQLLATQSVQPARPTFARQHDPSADATTQIAGQARATTTQQPRKRRQKQNGSRAPALLALLMIAIAIAAVYLVTGSSGGLDASPVIEQNVPDQVNGIRDLIENNTR